METPDKQRPLITILLLCYNHQNFVGEAVAAVLSQSYSPLEIIIFDDCSPDDTAEVIERTLAERQGRHHVRFIRSPQNIGGHEVCKMGLCMAKGDFMLISCGDDVMLPGMVEEMAKVWRTQNVSLVTANATYIDEHSNLLNRTFREPDQAADDSFETLARDGGNACCFGPAMGFDRRIYDKFGWVPRYLGCYDIMYPFYAYLLDGARFISKTLLKYRVHGQNTSLSLQAEKAGSAERALIEEHMFISHLAHATLMEEELDRLRNEEPRRYAPIAERIMPLLAIQQSEMGKKLARLSRHSGTLAANSRS
jgi:glycosyltransferase involved in cell wall biosynthesis